MLNLIESVATPGFIGVTRVTLLKTRAACSTSTGKIAEIILEAAPPQERSSPRASGRRLSTV
jgi:hypothetical protein